MSASGTAAALNDGRTRAQISVDIGGTFTDVLLQDANGRITSRKLPYSTQALAAAFGAGVSAVEGEAHGAFELLYSTTAALNGLLTGALPPIGLIVTQGFRDLMETARYAPAGLEAPAPRRLVALEHVREVSARMSADGTETRPLARADVAALAHAYEALGIGVVAVALLHSYRNPAHELAIAEVFAATAPHIRVVCSAAVLPELREYERALATCLNAALVPVLEGHLVQLAQAAGRREAPLYLMQASGGLTSAARAQAHPLTTALSGPAAAIVGMCWLGRESGFDDFITLDIGGTSTDVAVVRGARVGQTKAGRIAGFPLKLPMVDVLSIGAGGGSLASVAPDGRWLVGPASAGGEPGPICYGRGGQVVTLTDAELVLGRLPPALLGGTLPLDRDAAYAALSAFGAARGVDALATARGLLEIASHAMCGAIRRVSMLRGHDPRTFALLAMGGAGPLHAAELAELLGMRTVIVPPQPGLAAAYGMLVADVTAELVQGCGQPEDMLAGADLDSAFAVLEARADGLLAADDVVPSARRFERKLDLRYRGMTHEVSIDCPDGMRGAALLAATLERFHAQFEASSGHSHRGREVVEVVNLRLTARGERAKPRLSRAPLGRAVTPAARDERAVQFLGQAQMLVCPVHARTDLGHGAHIAGPAVIEQFESTTIVPPQWAAAGDAFGNLILRPAGSRGT